MRRRSKCLFILLILVSSFGCRDQERGGGPDHIKDVAGGRVIRQIDHILIRSDRAERLFTLLADNLRLPVAWPMTDFGGFASGGVAAGNVNLEIIRTDKPGARIAGFAIEPQPLSASLGELDRRGIAYGPPAVFRSGGFLGLGGKVRWTTVALPSVSSDHVEIFLCEYPDDVSARRRKWSDELRSGNGGPLSIVSVREIVYGSRDASAMRTRWRELLGPVEASENGTWTIGAGPALRVEEAAEDGIVGIAINVRSLAKARQYLTNKGMIRGESKGEITLGGPEFEGLTVTIVQEKGGS